MKNGMEKKFEKNWKGENLKKKWGKKKEKDGKVRNFLLIFPRSIF